MTTKVKINISPALQDTLSKTTGGGEVGVWALFFDDTGAPNATPLPVNSAGTAPAQEITLPTAFKGGKVYLIYQSVDSSADLLTFGAGQKVTKESDLTWGFSDKHQFRYDSFEVSLLGAAADAGNLTSLNAFGIPMSVEIDYPNGSATQTRGYNVTGSTIFTDIENQFTTQGGLVHKFTTGPLKDSFREAAGPSTILTGKDAQNQTLKGVSASDFYPYLESLGNALKAGTLPEMRVAGQFNGAVSVEYIPGHGPASSYTDWHNAGFYSYSVSYEPAPAVVHQGSFDLASNPISWDIGNPTLNIPVADASQYRLHEKIVLSGVTGTIGAYALTDINGQPLTIVNVIQSTNTLVVLPQPAKNSSTASTGAGGNGITFALPIGTDPLATSAGEAYITVTDANASLYAKTGTEVQLSGVTAGVDVFTADYINSTTFTISKIVSDTQYEIVATSMPEAQTTATGGGTSVAPTYTRLYAGTFVFTPDPGNSQVRGTIEISSVDLANSIYSTLGNAEVLGPGDVPFDFTQLTNNVGTTTTSLNTGANDQWGAFFVKLLTGLMGGYFGSTGTALNPLLGSAGEANLSNNWNFDPTYAFHDKLATTWSWDAAKYGDGEPFDRYAKIFFDNTNSYGNGYSDALMSLFQQGGPLLSTGYPMPLGNNPFTANGGSSWVTVSDPNAAKYQNGDLVTFAGGNPIAGIDMTKAMPTIAGTTVTAFTIANLDTTAKTYQVQTTMNATGSGAQQGGGTGVVAGYDVPLITLNLYDDNEPAAAGKSQGETQLYVQTEIYNTPLGTPVAPQGSGFSSDLSLQFSLGLGQMRPADDVKVSLNLYSGTGDTFQKIDFDSSKSLFQTWTYAPSGLSGSLTAAGQASPAGTILQINGLPYTTGTNWYQLSFESADGKASRAYNLYLDAVVGNGILNPAYIDPATKKLINPQGAIAVDGLGSYAFANFSDQHYLHTAQYPLVFNMFNGGTLSMDPELLAQITDQAVISAASNKATWPQPAAPVLGQGDASTFTLWGGSSVSAVLGTPYNTAALQNVTAAAPVFAWYGEDDNWLAYNVDNAKSGVIGAYTNKIGALNVAQVSFTGPHNPHPVTGTADLDGRWVTTAASLFNGNYTAVMNEFRASDHEFNTPLNVASSPLAFTVAGQAYDFAMQAGAKFLALDSGGAPDGGTWLKLSAVSSSLSNGTLLVYARDSSGNLIGRDGQITTIFEEAVLARLGSVNFDNGSTMHLGEQSVYLGVGRELHFATQTAAGTIDLLPDVVVGGSASSAQVNLSGNHGGFTFTATSDNNGSPDAQMAQSQNAYNQPWVYLTQGQDVHVNVQGSAWNYNTVHFVQIDVNPANGNWSVDGVAYGNTDAFRAAVAANWDPGFAATGGRGNFGTAADWTVSTGSGFYAPVLRTEGGDIFVIGAANVDGQNHIRTYGHNTFGFEDLRADQNSDFDYNDLVMKLLVA